MRNCNGMYLLLFIIVTATTIIIISFFIIVITIWETILLKLVVLKKYSGYKDGFQQENSGCQESMGLEEY